MKAMTQSRIQLSLEILFLALVSLSVLLSWVVTLMFMGVLEDDRILQNYFTRPSVYEIGPIDDPK